MDRILAENYLEHIRSIEPKSSSENFIRQDIETMLCLNVKINTQVRFVLDRILAEHYLEHIRSIEPKSRSENFIRQRQCAL